jgi:hypothetical protein
MAEPTALTGDEYMALLHQRRDEWMAAQPPRTYTPRAWVATPLLEQFVRPGDELLFTPPTEQPAPPPSSAPRRDRWSLSVDDLRARRDRLRAEADLLAEPEITDRAAAGGVGIGVARSRRAARRMDGRLARYVDLTRRIAALDARIARATPPAPEETPDA